MQSILLREEFQHRVSNFNLNQNFKKYNPIKKEFCNIKNALAYGSRLKSN